MLYGVRRVPCEVAMKGLTVVRTRDYMVPDAEKGLQWARSQVCTYRYSKPEWMPHWAYTLIASVMLILHNNYDWEGALGIALTPGRDWFNPTCWFCYETIAGVLRAAGRDAFAHAGYITESALLAIKP